MRDRLGAVIDIDDTVTILTNRGGHPTLVSGVVIERYGSRIMIEDADGNVSRCSNNMHVVKQFDKNRHIDARDKSGGDIIVASVRWWLRHAEYIDDDHLKYIQNIIQYLDDQNASIVIEEFERARDIGIINPSVVNELKKKVDGKNERK